MRRFPRMCWNLTEARRGGSEALLLASMDALEKWQQPLRGRLEDFQTLSCSPFENPQMLPVLSVRQTSLFMGLQKKRPAPPPPPMWELGEGGAV